jgi:hypothetical protein
MKSDPLYECFLSYDEEKLNAIKIASFRFKKHEMVKTRYETVNAQKTLAIHAPSGGSLAQFAAITGLFYQRAESE